MKALVICMIYLYILALVMASEPQEAEVENSEIRDYYRLLGILPEGRACIPHGQPCQWSGGDWCCYWFHTGCRSCLKDADGNMHDCTCQYRHPNNPAVRRG